MQAFLALIPWQQLFTILISLVGFIIKKSSDHTAAEQAFLKFISDIEKDVPIKINEKYRAQIERLREQIKNG